MLWGSDVTRSFPSPAQFLETVEPNIPKLTKDIIARMFELDAKKRPSAAELLNDPFLGDAAKEDSVLTQFHMFRGERSGSFSAMYKKRTPRNLLELTIVNSH